VQKNRIEGFSDGVLAIIITIMVLELKAPHGVELSALKPMLPVFIISSSKRCWRSVRRVACAIYSNEFSNALGGRCGGFSLERSKSNGVGSNHRHSMKSTLCRGSDALLGCRGD
jgi:hypothetical protein